MPNNNELYLSPGSDYLSIYAAPDQESFIDSDSDMHINGSLHVSGSLHVGGQTTNGTTEINELKSEIRRLRSMVELLMAERRINRYTNTQYQPRVLDI